MTETEHDLPYIWYSDDEYKKIMFSVRTQLDGLLKPLSKMYGQQEIVEGAVKQILVIFDLFGQRIRGKDIPISIIDKPLEDFWELLK